MSFLPDIIGFGSNEENDSGFNPQEFYLGRIDKIVPGRMSIEWGAQAAYYNDRFDTIVEETANIPKIGVTATTHSDVEAPPSVEAAPTAPDGDNVITVDFARANVQRALPGGSDELAA